jgi:hypothetical protein
MTSLCSQDVRYINKCVDICDNRISTITSLMEEKESEDYYCKLGVGILAFVKVERLIFASILNPNSKKEIFKLLLAKFDELICNSLEEMETFVRDDEMNEGEYLVNCKLWGS